MPAFFHCLERVEFRRTKIICTIGPATASYEMLAELHRAGMNVVRLNMSHADHTGAGRIVQWIRTLNRQVRYPVAVLLDTQGPEIRTGDMAQPMELKTGDVVSLAVRGDVDVEHRSIQVNYDDLVTSVDVGDRITIDNGLINFDVLEKDGSLLTCRVVDGGMLGSKRHVNLPGARVNLEVDLMARYAERLLQGDRPEQRGLTREALQRAGFINE